MMMSSSAAAGIVQPAEDALKLFVGQLPRNFSEDEVREALSEAGSICDISIVRDKGSRMSKGCAFVLFSTRAEAESAIELFHNKKTLAGSRNPLQVKFADGQEQKLENKLFIGMLPRTVTPEELRALVSPFGNILDLNLVKGNQSATKACAFVKFGSYSEAAAAIAALNDKPALEGSRNPLVVRWADSEKEKAQRRAQKAAVGGALGGGPAPFSSPTATPPHGGPPFRGGAAGGGYFSPPLPYLNSTYSPSPSFFSSPVPYSSADIATGPLFSFASEPITPYPSPMPSAPLPPSVFTATSTAPPNFTSPPPAGSMPLAGNGSAAPSALAVAAAVRAALAQKEGPPGANLFVHGLPSEWRDNDLLTAFGEFGCLLSARVYLDKETGASRNLGLVCFNEVEAAEAALAVMDGMQVGGRKLKLSIKGGGGERGISAASPY